MRLPRPGERRQELRLRARRFRGDLDLRGLQLAGPLELTELEVCGDLRLDEAQLLCIEARDVRIHGCLSLDAAQCTGLVRLRGIELGALRGAAARLGSELQLQGRLHGHLDLAGLQLGAGLEIPGLSLAGALCLNDAQLAGWADLSRLEATSLVAQRLHCGSGLELRSARIAGGVDLLDGRIEGPLFLRDALLQGELCLRRLRCDDRLDLVRVRAARVDARGLQAAAASSLAEARLQSLDLGEARLRDLDLGAARIDGPLFARAARCARLCGECLRVGDTLDLQNAQLYALELPHAQLAGLSLVGASVAENCVLRGAHVRGDGDLSADIKGNLDLGQSLWDTRLDLTPSPLRGVLQLQGARAAHARPDFAALRASLPRDPAEGLACCKVLQAWLEADNQYEAMDRAILAGHRYRRRLLARRWGGLGSLAAGLDGLLLGASCGYGMRPLRVLATGLVLVLLASLLCWLQPQAFGGPLSCPEALGCALAWTSGAPLTTRMPAPDSLPALLPPVLSLAGVLLAALFVGTLTRRLAR